MTNTSTTTTNLTQAQFLIWLGQQIHPNDPLYNMIFAFEIAGQLDQDRFAQAFDQLVAESDSLRSSIHTEQGVPMLSYVPPEKGYLELLDLSVMLDAELSYQSWLEQRRVRRLDLYQRVFDSVLVQLGPQRYVWYLNIHHIATDAASMALLYRRIQSLYQANASVEYAPPLFASYAAEEREHRQSASFARASAHWQTRLDVPVELLSFYNAEMPQPSVRTERVHCALGPQRSARLLDLASSTAVRSLSADMSRFLLLATALIAYLHRISAHEQIALGAPFHNRMTPARRETMGLLIEICPLYVSVKPEDSFASLAARVREESYLAMRHAQPGVSSAELNRSYQVLLNYLPFSFEPFAGFPTRTEWVHPGYGDSRHSLRLQVHDFDASGSYVLDFDLSTTVFSPAQRERAVAQFVCVLDAMLDDLDRSIGSVALASPDERRMLVEDFNTTAVDYPADQTIVQLIEAQVAVTPQAVALRQNERVLSYAELNQRADVLAHRLRESRLARGQLVGICMDRSFEAVIAILGVLKAGAAYVPLDPDYPAERLAFMLEEIATTSPSGQPLVLTQPHTSARLPTMPLQMLELELREVVPSITPDTAPAAGPDDLAYCIFTSGSTGKPKGVLIHHRGLLNYALWAREQYTDGLALRFPLFSSLSFDLTVTSIFVPLISGGSIVIYPESQSTPGLSVLQVFGDDAVDLVKLTPAHLALVVNHIGKTHIRRLIVGGEEFKTELAQRVSAACDHRIAIWNEYGPTETVVGCMIHRYDAKRDQGRAVPIGRPAANAQIYVLHGHQQYAPMGVTGELYIGGRGVGYGYLNRPELTAQRFLPDPQRPAGLLYRTGDLARWSEEGQLEFLGRADDQIKIGGYRIEPGEIEAHIQAHPAIREAVLHVWQPKARSEKEQLRYCSRCGLASNYPAVSYDSAGVCNVCRSYEGYRERAQRYFQPLHALEKIIAGIKARSTGSHDAIVLLSGGKDSTYMLCRLVEMGLRVLSFTLDNGFISEQAKANIRRVTQELGVEHVFASTPAMNAIFVESLQQYANVCNGCFKTVYTLAATIARERGIRAIFTGLSRGQFFETRLTEDVFRQRDFDPVRLDEAVLAARKAYHRRDDVISRSMDVDLFRSDTLFEDVEFVDFYRYCDVGLEEVYAYLRERAPWVRPSDTGRSTNCLINDAGIYVHKKQRGFHNYALPYSWDVRMGHKTRAEALKELDDEIDVAKVEEMLSTIGYRMPADSVTQGPRLLAYYVAEHPVSQDELQSWLKQRLPDYMLPAALIALPELPLTPNGKLDRRALPAPESVRSISTAYVAPRSSVEQRLAEIWSSVLGLEKVGIYDDFFQLGGSSLPALRMLALSSDAFQVTLPVQVFFEQPSVAALAARIEELLTEALASMSDEEAAQLLASLETM